MIITNHDSNHNILLTQPIEINGTKAYKNKYYLKGQISFFGNQYKNIPNLSVYKFKILALIRKTYVSSLGLDPIRTAFSDFIRIPIKRLSFGFREDQIKTFLDPFYESIISEPGVAANFEPENILSQTRTVEGLNRQSIPSPKKLGKKTIINPNPLDVVEALDAMPSEIRQSYETYKGILSTTYAENLLHESKKADIIILKMGLKYLTAIPPGDERLSENRKRIYDLVISNYDPRPLQISGLSREMANCIDPMSFYQIANSGSEKALMKMNEYKTILGKIKQYGKKWVPQGDISESFLKKLRELYCEFKPFIDTGKQMKTLLQKKKDHYEPLREFCFLFLDDLFEDIKNSGVVSRCRCCGNLFIPDQRKQKEHCDSYCAKNRKRLKFLFTYEI